MTHISVYLRSIAKQWLLLDHDGSTSSKSLRVQILKFHTYPCTAPGQVTSCLVPTNKTSFTKTCYCLCCVYGTFYTSTYYTYQITIYICVIQWNTCILLLPTIERTEVLFAQKQFRRQSSGKRKRPKRGSMRIPLGRPGAASQSHGSFSHLAEGRGEKEISWDHKSSGQKTLIVNIRN